MTPTSRPASEPAKAAAICKQFEPSEGARELLQADDSAASYLSALLENQLFTDAIRFTAYRLSKREAVWWGCLCAWQVCRPKPTPAESAALRACAVWVKEPSDDNRRPTEAVGNAALGTPAGTLALAVFLSGGSLSGPGLPPVAPQPGLTGRLVSEAVLLASRLGPPGQTAASQRRFLGIAAEMSTSTFAAPSGKRS